MIEEYFSSGDVSTVVAELEEVDARDFGHYFVKKLLTMAMDRKDREREMASVLLSSLYGEVGAPGANKPQYLFQTDILCPGEAN